MVWVDCGRRRVDYDEGSREVGFDGIYTAQKLLESGREGSHALNPLGFSGGYCRGYCHAPNSACHGYILHFCLAINSVDLSLNAFGN